jgi:hypothetical protein
METNGYDRVIARSLIRNIADGLVPMDRLRDLAGHDRHGHDAHDRPTGPAGPAARGFVVRDA